MDGKKTPMIANDVLDDLCKLLNIPNDNDILELTVHIDDGFVTYDCKRYVMKDKE